MFPEIGEEGCFIPDLQAARFPGEAAWFDAEISDRWWLQTTREDVVETFESLATIFLNDELPLLSYFESTWIGQSAGGRRLPLGSRLYGGGLYSGRLYGGTLRLYGGVFLKMQTLRRNLKQCLLYGGVLVKTHILRPVALIKLIYLYFYK